MKQEDKNKEIANENDTKKIAFDDKFDVLKQNEGLTSSNIELLQRISVLEQALYNLGKDPSKIK